MNALFVKELTTLDFSFLCPDRGLVGETWIVDVTLLGELNNEGMLFDFGHVKKQLKAVADDFADHKLLVPLKSDVISHELNEGYVKVEMNASESGVFTCKAPEQAITALPISSITIEKVTPWLTSHIKRFLPENVTGIDLQLYPESIAGAYYHYSHGLKKHTGDCQRIAHGHRSQLAVYINGHRSLEAESKWAERWCDIYLATREDIVQTGSDEDNTAYTTFGYTALQGEFELTLPSACCEILDTDTTVELLTDYAAREIKQWYPEQKVKVVLYEGVNKGAVSEV